MIIDGDSPPAPRMRKHEDGTLRMHKREAEVTPGAPSKTEHAETAACVLLQPDKDGATTLSA